MAKYLYNSMSNISKISFWVCLIFAIILLTAGFLTPKIGEIDGSILTAVGEIMGFTALGTVMYGIEKGIEAKFTHGNTSLTVNGKCKKDNKDKEE